jgi:hypothetical protein
MPRRAAQDWKNIDWISCEGVTREGKIRPGYAPISTGPDECPVPIKRVPDLVHDLRSCRMRELDCEKQSTVLLMGGAGILFGVLLGAVAMSLKKE